MARPIRRSSPTPRAGAPRPRRSATGAALGLAVGAVVLASAPAAGADPIGPPVQIAGTTDLATPWEIAPAPDGRTFVVERDGGIRVLNAADQLQPGTVLARDSFPGVTVRKLLGFALAPDFASSGLAYVYVATDRDRDGDGPETGTNGIWRLRAQPNGTFSVVDRVFDGIGSDGNHDGGRIVFGPDGALYVTTGDIHQPTRPQDPNNLNGKILRFGVPASGPLTAPADNPFVGQGANAQYVWSIGHRHPQGLAFDAAGRLWETEHGPTGEQHGAQYPGGNNQTGRDELNVIAKGANYGWPLVSGPDNRPGMTAPVAVAGSSPAWAPGDVAIGADGSVYAPFLAGAQLHRFDVRVGAVYAQASHATDLGRLRVAVARGSELLVARDVGGGIYRVPLSGRTPGGSDAADPPVLTTPPATTTPTRPKPTVTPPAKIAPYSESAMRIRTRALARKVRDRAKKLGARRLRAGRTIAVVSPGPSAGRTTIELRLGSSRGLLLARVRPTTRSTANQRYTIKLGTVGRRRLRATHSRRMVVRVIHNPRASNTYTSATSLRIPKRR
jgi:glucose/arabinose dehydrogenase